MKLEDFVSWLAARTTGGIRWGLDRTEELLAGVDDPHRRFHSVLIGGTNGKGSVAALCDAALRADDRRWTVGLYTSPHLVSFRERIRIDGQPVEPARLLMAADRLRPAIERTGASFFEAATAIAFLCFADAGVDIAVVEVGLGGRLDATNVLAPVASAVTNIALEHTEYLGDTLEQIAAEKAGIFRSGAPALTAETDPGALAVLRLRAAEVGAEFRPVAESARADLISTGSAGTTMQLWSDTWGAQTLRIPLPGAHQVRNALLAAELLGSLPLPIRPTRDAVEHGFASVRWPGRVQIEQIRGTTWLLDVAHNPAGVETLVGAIDALDLPRPLVLVAGILNDKEWTAMLPPLCARVDAVILTVPRSAPADRRWDLAIVDGWLRRSLGVNSRCIADPGAALDRAATLAPHGTVLVTGSVYTVGDAMSILDLTPWP